MMIPFSFWKSGNLLSKSEEFNDAYWVKNATTVTANATTDPLGGTTADLLLDTTTNTFHYLTSSLPVMPAGQYIFSVYAKAQSANRYLGFAGMGLGGAGEVPVFNLNTGTVDTGATTSIVKSAGIISIGSGWYRCWAIVDMASNTTIGLNPTFVIPNSATDNTVSGYSYAGTGTSGVYIWGAQFNAGRTLQGYQKKA